MDVAVYLKELLLEKGNASLPGLGSFSSQYQPAAFDETKQLFHPPCRNYFFHPEEDNTGSKLDRYISEKENIPVAEAVAEIGEYVKDCWYILNKGQRLQLMGVGVIYKDEIGKLCFDPDPLLVHGGEFYALESIPAIKHLIIPQPTEHKKRKFPLKTVLAVFMILVVVLGGLWVGKMVNIFQRKMELRGPLTDSTTQVKTPATHDSLTDTSLVKENTKPADTMSAPATAPEKAVNTPPTEVLQEEKTVANPASTTAGGPFVIIGGCFRSEEGAKKFNKQLVSKGYPSEILGKTGSGLTMVSYGAYPDKAAANDALEKIRREGDSGAYIIRH